MINSIIRNSCVQPMYKNMWLGKITTIVQVTEDKVNFHADRRMRGSLAMLREHDVKRKDDTAVG